MLHSKFIAVIATATMLTACAGEQKDLSAKDVGTATGAVAGGVVGYQFGGGVGQALATAGGALLGGVLGSIIGESWDTKDVSAYDQASQTALDTGVAQTWENSASGHSGTITPSRYYSNLSGQPCRDYSQTIYMNGQRHTGAGTACKQPDGVWRPVAA